MKLLVGLGNPGRKYQGSRHNIGFDVLDEVARQTSDGARKGKFEGELSEAQVAGLRTLLLWPQTYMNLSGTSVGKAADFYKIAPADVLVICDDFALPLAKLRIRAQGSAGGQKGLADIIRRLGTHEVPRLRVGIGEVPTGWNPADFVLSKFNADQGQDVQLAIQNAAKAACDWVGQGIDYCMNEYN